MQRENVRRQAFWNQVDVWIQQIGQIRKSWKRRRTNSTDGKWNGLETTQSLWRKRRRRRRIKRRRNNEEMESDDCDKDFTCSCCIIAEPWSYGRPEFKSHKNLFLLQWLRRLPYLYFSCRQAIRAPVSTRKRSAFSSSAPQVRIHYFSYSLQCNR